MMFAIEQRLPVYDFSLARVPIAREYFEKSYPTVAKAERGARLRAKRYGEPCSVYTVHDNGRRDHIATCLVDALDRVWTQVTAGPGTETLL